MLYKWIFFGVCLGVANMLPGLSGGTVALLLGFYQPLVDAVKCFRLVLLMPLGIGFGLSALLGAQGILSFSAQFPGQTRALLLGLVVGSVYHLGRQVMQRGTDRNWLFFALGFVFVFFLVAPKPQLGAGEPGHLLGFLLAGYLGGLAMLLPGLSGAAILLVMGYYETVLQAIASFRLIALIPFGIGMVVGVLSLTHIVSILLRRWYHVTMAVLTGMVLGSVRVLLEVPFSIGNLFLFMVGLLTIVFLDRQLIIRSR